MWYEVAVESNQVEHLLVPYACRQNGSDDGHPGGDVSIEVSLLANSSLGKLQIVRSCHVELIETHRILIARMSPSIATTHRLHLEVEIVEILASVAADYEYPRPFVFHGKLQVKRCSS